VELTDQEQRAVRALCGAGKTSNLWAVPIQAVDSRAGHAYAESRAIIRSLLKKRAIRVRMEATNGPQFSLSPQWWEAVDSEADGEQPKPAAAKRGGVRKVHDF